MELLVHLDSIFATQIFGEGDIDSNEIQLILRPLLDEDFGFSLRASVPNLGEVMTPFALKAYQNTAAMFQRCMDTTEFGDEVRYPELMTAGYRRVEGLETFCQLDAMWDASKCIKKEREGKTSEASVICTFQLKSIHLVSHTKVAKAIEWIIMSQRKILGDDACMSVWFPSCVLLSLQWRHKTAFRNHRDTGQFRERTVLTSAAYVMGSCLHFSSKFNDDYSRKRCSNCKMLVLVWNNCEEVNENICEVCWDDDRLVALLLSNKNDSDRKLYDDKLQLMVQMLLGASYLSAQWDNTMQLKVQVVKRVVLSWYWSVTSRSVTILVFDPGDTSGYNMFQIGFILEDKDDFKWGVLLQIKLVGPRDCWAMLRN